MDEAAPRWLDLSRETEAHGLREWSDSYFENLPECAQTVPKFQFPVPSLPGDLRSLVALLNPLADILQVPLCATDGPQSQGWSFFCFPMV